MIESKWVTHIVCDKCKDTYSVDFITGEALKKLAREDQWVVFTDDTVICPRCASFAVTKYLQEN